MIKNIIFDFGGVLIHLDRERCTEAFAECGVQVGDELTNLYGQRAHLRDFELGLMSVAEFHDTVRQVYGVPMTDEQKKAFADVLGAEEAEAFASRLQRGLPAISLDGANALMTAYLNDADPDYVYAQAVFGYGKKEDLLIGISTSGNSKNVVLAMKAAKALGVRGIALTGAKESKLSALAEATVRVPETETFKIQELHLPVYHYLCAAVEEYFFGEV